MVQVFVGYNQSAEILLFGQGTHLEGLQLAVKGKHKADVVFHAATQGLQLHHLVETVDVQDVGLHVTGLLEEGSVVFGHLDVGTLTEPFYQKLNMLLYQLVILWVDM